MAKTLKQAAKIERLFSIVGGALIVLTIIATIISSFANRGFVHDPLELSYYWRHLLLIGGGFAIGYFVPFRRQPKAKLAERTLAGITHGLLAYIVFYILDFTRYFVTALFGQPHYPLAKFLFEGLPLTAVLLTLALSFAIFGTKPQLTQTRKMQKIFVAAFVIEEVGVIVTTFLATRYAEISPALIPILLLGIVTRPLFIAGVAFLLLGRIKSRLHRSFYAAFIGAVYFVTTQVIWEFRLNASYDSTIRFSLIAEVVLLFASIFLIWRMHHLSRHK